MVNVSVDLAPAQIDFLLRLLKGGEYRSRSEAVRDFIRRAEFEWEWRNAIEETKDLKIDIETERSIVSKRLLKRFV